MIFENLTSLTLPEGNVEEIMIGGVPLWSASPVPRDYTLVDYIESTGVQYIDTGFQHNQNTRVVMDAQLTRSTTTTTSTALNNTNIGSFFTVTNGSTTWNRSNSGGGLGLAPANIGVHSSTATITLTAKVALSGVVIKGAYTTESNYDKVTLTVAGSTVLSAVSGTSTNAQRWSGSIAAGKTIVLTYTKDGSVNATSEAVSFTITCNPLTTTTASPAMLFSGCISASSAERNVFWYGNNSTPAWAADYNTSSNRILMTDLGVTDRLLIDFNKNVLSINSVVKNTWTETTFQSTANLVLLANNTGGTIQYYAPAKLYSCQIYDNDVKIRDFYPCVRKADNVAGLWDRVNKQFYESTGTGNFIAGPAAKSQLPKEYTRLEYIESTGTQYIDTNFCATSNTKIEADLQWTNLTIAQYSGSYSSSSYLAFGMNSKYEIYMGNTYANTGTPTTDRTIIIMDASNKTAIINGSSYTISYSSFTTTTTTHTIFALNRTTAINSNCSMKLYSYKIYDNDTLIRDFIPCINPSGEIGLYDLVYGVFYNNAGTGTFTAGPEV